MDEEENGERLIEEIHGWSKKLAKVVFDTRDSMTQKPGLHEAKRLANKIISRIDEIFEEYGE